MTDQQDMQNSHGDATGSAGVENLDLGSGETLEPIPEKKPNIDHEMDPALKAGLRGHVDSIDASGVAGWLLDLEHPDRVFQVDALLNGACVGTTETSVDRPDVRVIIASQVTCGFIVFWNPKLLARELIGLADSELLTLQVTARGEGRNIGADAFLRADQLREWLDAMQPEQFFGRLENVSSYRIAGFVIDRMTPNSPVSIEILLDGEVIEETVADVERKDLLDIGSEIRCGFGWLIPQQFCNGERRRVDVRIRGTDVLLPGSGACLIFFRPTTHPDKPNADGVGLDKGLGFAPGPIWTTGWVVDTNFDEPLAVRLFLDGELIGSTLAGKYGPELENNPAYPFDNVHTCFSFPTPRRALDGWRHEFLLHVDAWGERQLAKSRVQWARGDCFGNLDGCSQSRVSGWVAFRNRPSRERLSVPVEVFVDGQLVGMCLLGELRRDVIATGISEFAYRFEADLGCEIVGDVSVRYADVELKGSPISVATKQKLSGRLDGVARDVISGWAVNLKSPDDKIALELMVDGDLVASFYPNHARPDVNRSLGLGSTRVGFVVPTPLILRDGNNHQVGVRFASNKTLLESTISSVRFRLSFQGLPNTNPHPVLSEFIIRDRRAILTSADTPVVSIVVLNRNGKDILDALVSSFVAVNSFAQYEIIVIDHASKDASVSVLEKWSAIGVPLRIVSLPYNGSFSASNNLAVKKFARGEYVLLLNNDIVFVQDVLPELIRTLQDNPQVGLVGLKLLDVVEDRGMNFYPPIQHLGIRYSNSGRRVLPYDEKLSPNSACDAFRTISPAGVTGAVMLCRREEYLAIGGLDEAYFYGYEDVDICLKYRVINKQEVLCRNDLQVLHHRGYSRLSGREMAVFERLDSNHLVLNRRWGYAIRNFYRRSLIRGDRVYSSERIRIGFAVTETGAEAVAGDYFTALELARALSEFEHVEPVFLSERDDWCDLDGIHVLVVMRHDYDIRSITSARSDLVKVAWLRNHFESWLQQQWFDSFDIYLASAPNFVKHLSRIGYPCELFPIASNVETMGAGSSDASLRCVAGFNGSAWAVERNMVKVFEKIAAVVPTTIVGRGWEGSSVAQSYKGLLPYDRMPDFYASTEIVVDDANDSASLWGSANSRIFDALAAETLVITNSPAASADLFDGLLPVWNTPEEAIALISKYSRDPAGRRELTQKLRSMVKARHTYKQRAAKLLEVLEKAVVDSFRIAIKVPVPTATERKWWGDWHFARGLQKALKSMGHSVRIDLLGDWGNSSHGDDVVIVLRGLSEYTPDPTQINLLWILSHPEGVSLEECKNFEHVFSASGKHVAYLESLGVTASVLMQCADPEIMKPVPRDPDKRHEHLFVGNSRGQRRRVVSDLVTIGKELSIFGREWAGLAPGHMVVDDLINNLELREYYGNAGVVYNDHWPDMARWGFLSNRLFDAAACGAYVVSDKIAGLDEVFKGLIAGYETLDELAELSSSSAISRWGPPQARALREIVCTQHTFAHRAQVLIAKAHELREEKLSGRAIFASDAALANHASAGAV
jgi:GT2 family glycosyltransferase/spore maturation protein CgeB